MFNSKKWLLGIPAIVGMSTYLISKHIYGIATKPRAKYPTPPNSMLKYARRYYHYMDWYDQIPKQIWHLHERTTLQNMVATYIPNPKHLKKTVIIAHGFGANRATMANYAHMYYEMGFNVLLPDDRAHGDSDGQYISFGWLDQMDYLQWIDKLIDKTGKDNKILLFGVSMGGAIVSMLSGDNLPPQIKAIVSDCSYSSLKEEMDYLLKNNFHLPIYPFDSVLSAMNRNHLGYYVSDVSTTDQLAKNRLPILFIHGSKDDFVPTKMAYLNYRATTAPKQLWIVNNAGHAESFWLDEKRYQNRINMFLRTYFYQD